MGRSRKLFYMDRYLSKTLRYRYVMTNKNIQYVDT